MKKRPEQAANRTQRRQNRQCLWLNVDACKASEPQSILGVFNQGKLVAAIMGRAHFIVLRTVQDGKILVADPASTSLGKRNGISPSSSNKDGTRAGAGGPFWIVPFRDRGAENWAKAIEYHRGAQLLRTECGCAHAPLAAYLGLQAFV